MCQKPWLRILSGQMYEVQKEYKTKWKLKTT